MKARVCEACQEFCKHDGDCKAVIFNKLFGQCSLIYGDGPFREIELPPQFECFGISSAHKCECKDKKHEHKGIDLGYPAKGAAGAAWMMALEQTRWPWQFEYQHGPGIKNWLFLIWVKNTYIKSGNHPIVLTCETKGPRNLLSFEWREAKSWCRSRVYVWTSFFRGLKKQTHLFLKTCIFLLSV